MPGLSSAARILQRDDHIVIKAERGEGLKRLDDAEIVAVAKHTIIKMGIASERAVKLGGCADVRNLSTEQRDDINYTLSMAGIVIMGTDDKAQQILIGGCRQAQKQLDMTDTLRLFLGNGEAT